MHSKLTVGVGVQNQNSEKCAIIQLYTDQYVFMIYCHKITFKIPKR